MHLFRDAIGLAAYGAGYVSAMSIAVGGIVVVIDFIDARRRPSFKLRVGKANAGVDDIGVDARTAGVVRVGIVEREVVLIEPVETPVGIRFRVDDVHHLRLFDVGNQRMLSQRCGGRIGQMRRETAQSVRVRESERTRMRSHKGSRGAADILDGRVQHDDVLSRDQFLRRVRRVQRNRPARCDRRRCFGACKRTSGRHDGDAPDKSPHELNPPTEKNVRWDAARYSQTYRDEYHEVQVGARTKKRPADGSRPVRNAS